MKAEQQILNPKVKHIPALHEATIAAARPRRSVTASLTSIRPLQVIHTRASSLIKSFSVLAPPDP